MTAGTTVLAYRTNKRARKLSSGALTASTFDLSFAAADLEENDVLQCGYVPGGVTVIGFIVTISDIDTDNSPAVVNSVLLGSTTLVAGIADGQAGGQTVYGCTPTTTTVPTVVSLKTTTAPTVAAETGTAQITVLYFSA